ILRLRRRDRPKVHLGLARSGHAVEQERRRGSAAERRHDRVDRGALRARRLRRRVAGDAFGEERIARKHALLDANEAVLAERLGRLARVAELLLEARERDGPVRADVGEHARGAFLHGCLDELGGLYPLDFSWRDAFWTSEEQKLTRRLDGFSIGWR